MMVLCCVVFILLETLRSFADPVSINPYNADIRLYKPWKPYGYFQFEISINIIVSFFRFIWIIFIGLRPL